MGDLSSLGFRFIGDKIKFEILNVDDYDFTVRNDYKSDVELHAFNSKFKVRVVSDISPEIIIKNVTIINIFIPGEEEDNDEDLVVFNFQEKAKYPLEAYQLIVKRVLEDMGAKYLIDTTRTFNLDTLPDRDLF